MADGTEMLLNSHVEGDTVVIHETAKHFVLRLGKSVLGLENRSSMNKARLIEPAPAIMILSVLVERRKADEILRQIQTKKSGTGSA